MPARLDRWGVTGPTPGQARGKNWRRVGPGLYVPVEVDPLTVDQRIVEAVAGTGGAATGWAALHWMGATWFGGLAGDGRTQLPVPIALGDRRQVRPRPGVHLSEDWLFDEDLITIDGVRVTVPERSVTYEVRRARGLPRAVRILDMAAFDDLVDLADLEAYVSRLVSRGGVRLLKQALPWAEENAWSPLEVDMRLEWLGTGLADALLCNRPLFDLSGRHLLTPDLFDPVAGVAGEYNGAVHDGVAPRRRDLDREELYRRLGIESVAMMSTDSRDVSRFVGRLHAAYRRAEDRGERSWTTDQPEWWVDTSRVSLRRALTPEQRARWLRRQRRSSYLT
ncbi:hypothetical protein F0U44_02865 [Nocardioides humilatus]|uniref:Transcriptional regulator, AbiEi antitoxin, Type IV TA system n=2 Tax=Nocardioides humilatus TaxID=2607660 RepID=A0A5B1LPT0_9ACTN|nr:hypothetical protein F0U44_02865 [Nocardioides humilatus]